MTEREYLATSASEYENMIDSGWDDEDDFMPDLDNGGNEGWYEDDYDYLDDLDYIFDDEY